MSAAVNYAQSVRLPDGCMPTVAELRALLRRFDPDLPIMVGGDGHENQISALEVRCDPQGRARLVLY